MWNKKPEDDKNYLVSWYDKYEKKYSTTHRAYWCEQSGHFFSLESLHAHPLHVDIWTEIPELPTVNGEE